MKTYGDVSIPSFDERCNREATDSPIFLFQAKRYSYNSYPSGYECDSDDGFYVVDESDVDEAYRDEEGKPLEDLPMDQLLDDGHVSERWETELVFLSREEGVQYGNNKHYNYPDGWRVYAVPTKGALREMLKESAQ